MIRAGAKRKVSARDPIFCGSCVPKPVPPEESNITWVPQAAERYKEQKLGINKEAQSIKTANIGVHSTRTGKMWEKMGGNRLK